MPEASTPFGWSWQHGPIRLRFEVRADGTVRLRWMNDLPGEAAGAGLPPLDILTVADGRGWSGFRYVESTLGARMRYRTHQESTDGGWREHLLSMEDPETGLRADLVLRAAAGLGVLRSFVRLHHGGTEPVVLEAVTSLVAAGLPGLDPTGLEDIDVYWADNDWLAENRWQRRPARDLLPDVDAARRPVPPCGCFARTGEGSWSTGRHLPMGALVNRRDGHTWLWQIEHNGAWHWQVGEHRGGLYLALLGPTSAEHQWRLQLRPGESFETVPVAVAVADGGFDAAVADLTRYRRALRRPHPDHTRLPVVFNDYMNTLMGDPTTERLLPLIDAAARAGAEYFCVDAGWYAETGEDWWGTVGAWRPSRSRFPGGIGEILDRIRAAGMVPGLWLEPEAVGVSSPVAGQLPAEAFFRRAGVRVRENGRYHLDLSHPAAVAHLDEVVDRLVAELGIGYLKLDYNLNIQSGTESHGASAGAGLLGHNRALLRWLDAVLDRHPHLVIENCASGAMRSDPAMLSRLQLQSTSDQQDPLRYPPIAAAAPALIPPEQCGNWAYPQPTHTADEIGFTLCTAMLGRLYLSGHLNRMDPGQFALVSRAVEVYKRLRPVLADAVPFWPSGLPQWDDASVSLGMRSPEVSYVVVWCRATSGLEAWLALPHLAGDEMRTEVLFPPHRDVRPYWDAGAGRLRVRLAAAPSACLIALHKDQNAARP
ncbi:glycoside hydrolase family 36 protein [Rugosimonospora acidiphila]